MPIFMMFYVLYELKRWVNVFPHINEPFVLREENIMYFNKNETRWECSDDKSNPTII